MPITYGAYTKERKLLPLTLHANGTATVSVRTGFADDGGVWLSDFTSEKAVNISADGVSEILDAKSTEGMTRRDDLSLAVYMYLVKNGLIEAGEIS